MENTAIVEPVDALDEKFREILRERNKEFCPDCDRHLSRLDAHWNNGSTEAGTGYSVAEVICSACSALIARATSWYPSIDDFEEYLYVLEKDWEED